MKTNSIMKFRNNSKSCSIRNIQQQHYSDDNSVTNYDDDNNYQHDNNRPQHSTTQKASVAINNNDNNEIDNNNNNNNYMRVTENNSTNTVSQNQHQQQQHHHIITEAQLRWAQFHHKRVAKRVQEKIHKLYLSPTLPSQVPGYSTVLFEDDELEEEDNNNNNVNNNNSIIISKGRKALLQVSKHNYEKRKEHIQQYGYEKHAIDDENESTIVDDDDALAIIFAEESVRKRRRRKRKRRLTTTTSYDQERIQRFEQAFHAMLQSLANTKKKSEDNSKLITSNKKWTRPVLDVSDTVDGREYLDLKWGVLKSSNNNKNNKNHTNNNNNNNTLWNDDLRQHFTDIAKQYYNEEDDDEVATIVEEFEKQILSHENNNNNNNDNIVSRFIQQYESRQSNTNNDNDNDTTNPAAATVILSPSTANLICRFESFANNGNNKLSKQEKDEQIGFVKQFVQQIEQASKNNKDVNLVAADGKLHKPNFAILIERYLNQATITTPKANNSNNNNTSTFVRVFINQLEHDDEVDTIISSEGTINVPILEKLIYRNLTKATEECLKTTDTNSSNDNLALEEEETIMSSQQQRRQSRAVDFFGRLRTVSTKINYYRSNGQSNNEDTDNDDDNNTHLTDDTQQSNNNNKKKGTVVTNKVGELFQSLHGKTAGIQEYSKFRQTQTERRASSSSKIEDTSSVSSFRVLPAGIRKIVMGFRNTVVRPAKMGENHHLDDDSEHKYESDSILEYDDDHVSSSREGSSHISSEHAHQLHAALLENQGSANMDDSMIDTDASLASGHRGDSSLIRKNRIDSLMLSPTIITKRHQQAIKAVEDRKWDNVQYLLSANPWLAEMADVNTNQYILHKLAFYGAEYVQIINNSSSNDEDVTVHQPAAPEQVCNDLVRMFPSSVYKFDIDGNLPLHMAAASYNYYMIKLLGDRFPSGASVRNEDGMLPLHLAILASASPTSCIATDGSGITPKDVISTIVEYFPGALAVVDNDGNLPIHTAASVLNGQNGVDVIYYLLDESERQVSGPNGLRFRNKVKIEELDDETIGTEPTVSHSDSSIFTDDTTNCLLVRNEHGDTPIATAIYCRSGWEIIESLICKFSVMQPLDEEHNTALHLLLGHDYQDPSAAMAILKAVPETSTVRNDSGMLPIEVACIGMLPREVILALVLIDLPINLDQKDNVEIRSGFGGSWWYLTCDCDDHYADIVEEVISLCSFPQIRALTYLKHETIQDSLISRATPKCKFILSSSQRFMGRFELLDNKPSFTDPSIGMREFEALDYGTQDDPIEEGRRVLLRCFDDEEEFLQQTTILDDLDADPFLFEEIMTFCAASNNGQLSGDGSKRFFVVVERPDLTLNGVVRGLLVNAKCQSDAEIRRRYTIKVLAVLRLLAKSLRKLHSIGLIHGDVCLENCGKFDDLWKLSDVLGAQRASRNFEMWRLSSSAPPESIEPNDDDSGTFRFRDDLIADITFDSWSFGKVAYEVLVGDTLIEFDVSKDLEDDHDGLATLCNWDEQNVEEVKKELQRIGISDAAQDLIASCLAKDTRRRPSMDQILNHPVWSELRRSAPKTSESNVD